MIAAGGYAFTFLGTGSAVLGLIAAIQALRGRWPSGIAVMCAAASAVGFAGASVLMIVALLARDFSVSYVAQVGSRSTPALFTVSSLWAALEGSILLWASLLAVVTVAAARWVTSRPPDRRPGVLAVLHALLAFFGILLLGPGNPWRPVFPVPADGPGPNPLLAQHPLMVIHPPLLYLGFVGLAVPFALTVDALWHRRLDDRWIADASRSTVVAWIPLTLGLTAGAWWSYAVLGWGGYWAWDPVENVALLPWLTGTALIHSAIVVEKREALKTWSVLLAIATFSLSLCGTFLVRSGLLNSVHAFSASPAQGLFILVLLALTIGGSLLLFAFRAPALAASGVFAPVSREGALILNNIFLCIIAAVVFTGTMYPPFLDLLFNRQISVGAPFYDQTVLPLTAPLILAMAVGPMMSWKRAVLLPALTKLWFGAVVALIVFGAFILRGHFVAALGLAGAVWVMIGALIDLAERVRLFRVPLRQSFARLFTIPRAAIGASLGHLGFGIAVLGIAGMSLQVHTIRVLNPGQSIDLGGYNWKLISIAPAKGANYAAREATIEVTRNGHFVEMMHPETRFFTNQKVKTVAAAISTNGVRNLFATFAGDNDSGGGEFRFNIHPLAPEIWLGGLIMALGGAISLTDRRFRVGAPVRNRLRRPSGSATV